MPLAPALLTLYTSEKWTPKYSLQLQDMRTLPIMASTGTSDMGIKCTEAERSVAENIASSYIARLFYAAYKLLSLSAPALPKLKRPSKPPKIPRGS